MRARITAVATLLILVLVPALCAGEYASLNGKFRITYPDDWRPVDYRVVDSVLFGGNQYSYDVVLAPTATTAFENGNYLVVTVDTGASYSNKIVDSVLDAWKTTLVLQVKRFGPDDDFSADWNPISVNYWPKSSLASVCTEAAREQGDHTRNQLVVKFSALGSANFYFYGPDSTWGAFQPIIQSIINSYSTENIEAALPHGQLKMLDSAQLNSRTIDSPGTDKRTLSLIIFGIAAAILIIVLVAWTVVKKKNNRASIS